MDYTEAMCAGLPIVGWRAGNLPNLIDDGVEGILVPTGNVGASTAAYLRLATETAAASIPSLLSRQGSWHTSMPFWAGSCRPKRRCSVPAFGRHPYAEVL
jgi:glycosyltransferase involved in cell wall biosynthesis